MFRGALTSSVWIVEFRLGGGEKNQRHLPPASPDSFANVRREISISCGEICWIPRAVLTSQVNHQIALRYPAIEFGEFIAPIETNQLHTLRFTKARAEISANEPAGARNYNAHFIRLAASARL